MCVVQIIGLGTVVMTPLIGNLSDVYGRKSLLTVPLTLSIIPLGTCLNIFLPTLNLLVRFFSALLHAPASVSILAMDLKA